MFQLLVYAGIPGTMARTKIFRDTGSDAMTIYTRDILLMDPNGVYPRGPKVTFLTANGSIERVTIQIQVLVLDSTGMNIIGSYFNETGVIESDVPIVDEFGNQKHDQNGLPMWVDDRLSGIGFKNSLFFGSGPVDRRLVLATNKTGMVLNIPAR